MANGQCSNRDISQMFESEPTYEHAAVAAAEDESLACVGAPTLLLELREKFGGVLQRVLDGQVLEVLAGVAVAREYFALPIIPVLQKNNQACAVIVLLLKCYYCVKMIIVILFTVNSSN